MGYREIPEDKILKFPATPGFKGWKQFFIDESITHPAKMNLNLLRWILETYTELGELVLDPMAGTGSTIILASLLGRNGIAVEYESRFCEMIRENIKRTEKQSTLTPKGNMNCIQGDARELSRLLGEADAVVTSPPFGPSTKGGGIFKEGYRKPGEKEVSDPGLPQRHARPLSDDPRNIDNLEYGESVDTVITSPPYEGSVPAYDETWLEEHWDDESESPAHKTMRFGRSMKGYPKEVDNVITSPPYEQGLRHRGEDFEEVRKKLLAQGYSEKYIKGHWNAPHQCQRWAEEAYGKDSDNIGNLKSESYLEAMLQVYRECWKVLKQSGKLILVTKNFIRDKQVVRLDLDTIRLCEAAGFTLQDRWYFKLPTKSFWRILYRRKYPDVPEVEYEDVLVFKKINLMETEYVR